MRYAQLLHRPHSGVRALAAALRRAHGGEMTTTTGVLTVLTDPVLRQEVDRIGAAVGLRVIHADTGTPPNKKTWAAAAAVVLDDTTLRGCRQSVYPRRAHVVVLAGAEPTAATWAAAVAVGAQHVLTLPDQESVLVTELAEAGECAAGARRRGRIATVIGGCGGAGTSVFAAALAQSAPDALLVDLDPWGGGIDLVMTDAPQRQLNWSDLALQGGRLTWSAVREALPIQRGVTVLSGSRHSYELEAEPVDALIDAGRRGGATVLCDLPRRLTDAVETALAAADLVVLISRCDVRAAAATAAFAPVVAARNPNVGLVVRGPAPGGLRAAEIAEITTVPLLASMRAEPRVADHLESGGLRLRRRSGLAAAARRVLGVLATEPAGERAA